MVNSTSIFEIQYSTLDILFSLSPIDFPVFIHVNGPFGPFDNLRGFCKLLRPGNLEEPAALLARDPLIGGVAIEHPHMMAFRTCGPNLHQQILNIEFIRYYFRRNCKPLNMKNLHIYKRIAGWTPLCECILLSHNM